MAAGSVTSLARSAGYASSPVVGGARLQGSLLVLGLSFVVAGALKAAYESHTRGRLPARGPCRGERGDGQSGVSIMITLRPAAPPVAAVWHNGTGL
jgi:hypothetical protein